MSREKTFAKNTLIITIGKICTQLITFFLLPLYTGVLSTEEYGTVDLLNTLVSLLLPIITLQVEEAMFRYLIENRDNDLKKNKVISSAFFSIVIQTSVYIGIFCIIYPHIHNEYKIFLATNVLAHIYSSFFLQIARGLGKNKNFSIGSFVNAFVTIISNIFFLLVIKNGANGMLIGTLLGQLSSILYIFVSLKIYRYIDILGFEKEVSKKLLKYSIPLVPNAISWWIFNASDRVIVSSILGISQNGILSAASKFSSVYITLYNILNITWVEMISLHIKDKDIENFFNKMFDTLLRVFISLAIGVIAFMPFVYPIMINKNFSYGYKIVPILIIASLFNVIVSLIGSIYVANKNTKSIAITSIIAAIINIVVHLMFIKYIGLYAAAVSTLVSFIIMCIYRMIDVRKKYFKIKFNKKIIIKTIIILVILLITYYINNFYCNIILAVLSIIFAYDLNKDNLNIIINIFKNKILKK